MKKYWRIIFRSWMLALLLLIGVHPVLTGTNPESHSFRCSLHFKKYGQSNLQMIAVP